jgi:dihydroxy-acid dehydratase
VGIVVAAASPDACPSVAGLLFNLEKGVRSAGGDPVRIPAPGAAPAGSRDGADLAYPRRELIADGLECAARAAGVAGLLLAADRSEEAAGLLLGAARVNLPVVFVPSGEAERRSVPTPTASLASVARAAVQAKPPSSAWPPVDPFRNDYAARAVSVLAEGLGLALPASSTAPAGSPEQFRLAAAAGRRAVELVGQNHCARRTLLLNAFLNAARLDAVLGGRPESLLFLLALAHEAGVKLSLEALVEAGQKTAQLVDPGEGFPRLHAAGGVPAILAALKGQWAPHTTVSGRGVNELAKVARVKDPHVVRLRAPLRRSGGPILLHGNLASRGALFRPPEDFVLKADAFSGPARVYDSREAALEAVLAGRLRPGDVLVVRYEGARGGPGLRPLAYLAHALEAKGLAKSVALVTDGLLGAPVPPVLAVELAAPEAADGTALSVLREGDRVEIHPALRRLSAHLTDTDLKVRLARWQAPPPRARNGFLARYARSVGPALEGALVR